MKDGEKEKNIQIYAKAFLWLKKGRKIFGIYKFCGWIRLDDFLTLNNFELWTQWINLDGPSERCRVVYCGGIKLSVWLTELTELGLYQIFDQLQKYSSRLKVSDSVKPVEPHDQCHLCPRRYLNGFKALSIQMAALCSLYTRRIPHQPQNPIKLGKALFQPSLGWGYFLSYSGVITFCAFYTFSTCKARDESNFICI